MSDSWTVGDTWPPLGGTVTDGGTPVDLSGADTVTVTVKKPDRTTFTRAVIRGTGGAWSMAWQTGDISVAGQWQCSINAVWAGQDQTFAGGVWQVAPNLTGAPAVPTSTLILDGGAP